MSELASGADCFEEEGAPVMRAKRAEVASNGYEELLLQ